jgi:TatA/E family protein of Tat protein translocase
MFAGALQPMHWLMFGATALLFFGPQRLPELGKAVGEAIRGFKTAAREGETVIDNWPVPPHRS